MRIARIVTHDGLRKKLLGTGLVEGSPCPTLTAFSRIKHAAKMSPCDEFAVRVWRFECPQRRLLKP